MAIDYANISPSAGASLARTSSGPAEAAKANAENKRRYRFILRICEDSNLGFQPVIFEILGGWDDEIVTLLSNLCQEGDRVSGDICRCASL